MPGAARDVPGDAPADLLMEAGATARTTAPAELPRMVRAAFGDATVDSVMELAGGRYNRTFRVDLAASGPVVLRIAPEPAQQLRIERTLMRNEVAAAPFLEPIAALMPRLLATDFSHRIVGADYLFQEFLPGIPGATAFPGLADTGPIWHGLGEILARIHGVEGTGFGRVQGPLFPTWSQALAAAFANMVQDMDDAGLVAADFRSVTALLARHQDMLNDVGVPRLLHGDLWIGNVILGDGPAPRITGVVDSDRASWGDPAADWTLHLLRRRNAAEKQEFWRGYGGEPVHDAGSRIREFFYQARSLGEARLEYHRTGMPAKAAATYPRLEQALDAFISLPRQ